MKNRLWLLTQDEVAGYSTYDSAVVSAKTEEQAKGIHPSGDRELSVLYPSWATRVENIKAKCLGITAEPEGVICASFNAG